MYVNVKELPELVQSLLKGKGYHKADVAVVAAETVSPMDCGSDGQRGYLYVVNLGTGKYDYHEGSWGGANMFNPTNRVDLDRNSYAVPVNGLVIKGSEGYRSHATVYVNGWNINPAIESDKTELTERELRILACFRSYTSAYRNEVFGRMKVTGSEFESLRDGGYIKIAKNGSKRITTKGKNACSDVRMY